MQAILMNTLTEASSIVRALQWCVIEEVSTSDETSYTYRICLSDDVINFFLFKICQYQLMRKLSLSISFHT
jgi:hypothetical protein